MSSDSYSNQIIKFEKILSEQPRSQVFAPLSELYCKIGLFDKAMALLKKGIRYNPNYVLGYIALANCYKSKGEQQLAYSTLLPLVSGHRDNIKLQLLFARIAKDTGNIEESLDTYKYLHFLKPGDSKIMGFIKELEAYAKKDEDSAALDQNISFDLEGLDTSEVNAQEYDEWEQVNLAAGELEEEDSEEGWTTDEIAVEEVAEKESSEKQDDALFTHTLVDLYFAQGYHDRAIDILKKILELKPGDEKTVAKLKELESNTENDESVVDQSEGHQLLSNSLDQIFESDEPDTILSPMYDFRELILSKKKDILSPK